MIFLIRCRGVVAMLQHNPVRFVPRSVENCSVTCSMGASVEELYVSRRHRAEPKLYIGPRKQLGITTEMLCGCLNEGATQLVGSKFSYVGEAKRFSILDLLQFREASFIPFDPASLHPDRENPDNKDMSIRDGWLPDVRYVKHGDRMCRPKFPTWAFEVHVEIEEEIFTERTEEFLRALFRAGGRKGIGAFRPNFGRFTVERFERIDG